MKNYKKMKKNIVDILVDTFEEDEKSKSLNELNEKVLTKEINKALKKNEQKPINTHLLIK